VNYQGDFHLSLIGVQEWPRKKKLLRLEKPINEVLRELATHHILGGYQLAPFYPEMDNCLLVCATEMRTGADIEHYVEQLKLVMD